MNRLSVTAAALMLAVSAPAMAQDQTQSDADQNALSAGEVREFFSELDRQAQQTVEQKDWQGIQGWISQHVHEEAAIFMKGRFATAEGMAFSYEGTMDGGHLQRFAYMSMGGGMADKMGIDNYEVWADVHKVSELATGWAGVHRHLPRERYDGPRRDASRAGAGPR